MNASAFSFPQVKLVVVIDNSNRRGEIPGGKFIYQVLLIMSHTAFTYGIELKEL